MKVIGGQRCAAKALLCVALLAFAPKLWPAPAAAAQHEAIHLDLQALPGAKRYVELAAYPSYLAIALQNNGFMPSQSGRVIVEDGRTLRFKNAVLSFVRADGGVFHYKVVVDWSIGVTQSQFELPVEADLSRIGEGSIAIRIFPPMAKLFPQELAEKIRLKAQSIATSANQQRMLDYFDGLPGSKGERLDTTRMFERILIDAFNLPVVAPGLSGGREPGDAEALSDQWMLLATLAIWLLIVPGIFVARARWSRTRNQAAATENE